MKTLCQCPNHCVQEENNINVQESSTPFDYFQDVDVDADSDSYMEENEEEKYYDSDYVNILPRR